MLLPALIAQTLCFPLRSEATPPSAAQHIRDTISGARLGIIADAAHIPTMERPADVAGAMASFLGTVSRKKA